MRKLKNIAIIILFIMLSFACLIPLFALYQYAILQKKEYLDIYKNIKDVAIYLIPIILSIVGIGTINVNPFKKWKNFLKNLEILQPI